MHLSWELGKERVPSVPLHIVPGVYLTRAGSIRVQNASSRRYYPIFRWPGEAKCACRLADDARDLRIRAISRGIYWANVWGTMCVRCVEVFESSLKTWNSPPPTRSQCKRLSAITKYHTLLHVGELLLCLCSCDDYMEACHTLPLH